jgi:hypothetical protein
VNRGTDDEIHRRTRRPAGLVLNAAFATMALAGCGSPAIVNTGEPWTPVETPAPTAQLPEHTNNRQLADASEYYTVAGARKAYRFATPSGRWNCMIVPHTSAGCRPATSSPLSITGAPTAVPGADGSQVPPTAFVLGRNAEAQFVAAEDDPVSLPPGPATTLPFGRVLAAAGFRCNVQEASGVSCGSESSGKGFTFSADGYSLTYTDVPKA